MTKVFFSEKTKDYIDKKNHEQRPKGGGAFYF